LGFVSASLAGIRTVSITWITPIEASMSAAATQKSPAAAATARAGLGAR